MAQIVNINNVGSVGYIGRQDKRAFELPPEAWSKVQNIRFHNGAAQALGVGNCVSQHPHEGDGPGDEFVTEFTYHVSAALWWVSFGSEAVYALQPANASCATPVSHSLHTESVPYTGSNPKVWVVDKLFGNIIATNQQSSPLYLTWDANIGGVAPEDSLQKLPGWEAEFGVDASCEAIAAAKGFILAGNISTTGTGRINVSEHFATRVAWSDQILDTFEYGARIPDSWDASDPTKQAGAFDLPSNTGQIVAMKRLRDDVIIYTERSMYRIFYVGGAKIWDYREIFSNQGIYGPKCVEEFEGKHFIVGTDDILLYDGQQVTTLADGRVRRDVYDYLTFDTRKRINLGVDFKRSEIHVLFPSKKSINGVDSDLVWSWEDNVWSLRELETSSSRTDGSYTTILRENLTLDGGVSDPDTSSKAWDDFDPGVTWDSFPAGVTWGSTISSLGDTDMYGLGYFKGIEQEVTYKDIAINLGAIGYFGMDETAYPPGGLFSNDISPSDAQLKLVQGSGNATFAEPPIIAQSSASYGISNTDNYSIPGSLVGEWDNGAAGTKTVSVLYSAYTDMTNYPNDYDGLMEVRSEYVNASNNFYLYRVRATGELRYGYTAQVGGPGNPTTWIDGGTIEVVADWSAVHIVAVAHQNRISIYVNGVKRLDNVLIDVDAETDFDYFRIISAGKTPEYSLVDGDLQAFAGKMDEVATFALELSATQVEQLYNGISGISVSDYNVIYRVANSYARYDRSTAIKLADSVSILERQQLDLTGEANASVVLHVYPRVEGDYPFNIYVGAHDNTDQEAVWEGPFPFDPLVDHKIDCRVRGRRHALRFEAIGVPLRIFGYDIEHEISGER